MRIPALLVCFVLALAAVSLAQPGRFPGWQKGSAYDKLYEIKEAESVKGEVTDIFDLTPMPGMAAGLALTIKDKKDGKTETAHLGPKEYVKLDSIGLKKGDRVRVNGVWANVGGKDVLLASKIKKDDGVELKLRRTRDGFPFWDMSPEELAAEKKGD